MKNKKVLIGLLSLTMLSCFGAGMMYTASAGNVDPLQPVAGEFEMIFGARARVNSVGDSGIRFETNLSESWVNELKEAYPTAELKFGTLIAPTKNVNDDVTNLTSATADVKNIVHASNSNLVFKDGEATLNASVTYDKAKLKLDYETAYDCTLTDAQATALIEKTYDIELTARAYCLVEVPAVGETPAQTYTYYAISNDNSRTARRVINAAVLAGTVTDTDIINKYIGAVEEATAYADLEGDVVFDADTANTIYVGAKANHLALDNGYVAWPELVAGKAVGDELTVSTIVNGKVTRINVSVIDNVITKASELSALNNTSANGNVKTYALGKNLDASAITMSHDNATGAGFGGLFDGMGHTISGLNVGSGSGLFGEFATGATVQNFALYNVTVNKGFYLAENSPEYTMKNVYVKLTEESTNPKGISKMTNNQVLENVVVEYTGANAVKVPTSINSTGWDAYGVLCFGIHTDSCTLARDDKFKDVYVISPSLLEMASLSSFYLYGKNETTDVWGRSVLVDGKASEHTFAEGESPFGGVKYKNVPMQNTYHYDSYLAMATDENELTSFDGKYWVVCNGAVYWKDIYVQNINVVATDETDEEIEQYQLQATADEVNVSLVDMYGNTLENVNYAIVNNDGNLKNENGTFSLTNAVLEDKEYTVTLKTVVNGIKIEKNITIKAVANRTTYTQEVYLATNSDYNGTDQYVLTNAGLDAMPTGITSASLNGVELLVTDGNLPDITMSYYKKFRGNDTQNYAAQVRETHMDIWASRGNSLDTIVEKKADQAPLTLTLTTNSGIVEFTNLFVCTDVIQVATDLERFEIRNLTNAETQNNDGYYVMTNNIDASALNFAHQRDSYEPYHRFVGAFDGRGYTISNLNLDQATTGYTGSNNTVYGLFGNLYGADILNVGFVNVSAEDGSVLGGHSGSIGAGFCTDGILNYSDSIYPDIRATLAYASTRIENVYIQVADSVTAMKGALCPSLSDRNVVKNVVVEWNPTNATPLTSNYGSLVGSGKWSDGEKPTRANIVVLSSVQLNSEMSTCSGVTVYADRAAMESQNTASLASFAAYWTTTSNSPVWKTANWQQNN
ncbi:MAG: hypothetical protein IKA88_05245 [Clostridia bacterium]|nr:hypothetical protein [Clostridia bacterium]